MKTSSFINMPSCDAYFICQMVDRFLNDSFGFARNIEDFMGDMACARLLDKFPKYSPLHEYIEEVVTSVIWEDQDKDSAKFLDESNIRWGNKLWVDYLLEAHGFEVGYPEWVKQGNNPDITEYMGFLQEDEIMWNLVERVTKEAFHILFTNRKVLLNFGKQAAFYIRETAPGFFPEKFTSRGHLPRTRIPQWAKNAIFHRDKGMCVQCGADLTRLVNQQNALHFDHIIPLAKGGMNDITNLQLLCETCNLKKSDKVMTVHNRYESWYKY